MPELGLGLGLYIPRKIQPSGGAVDPHPGDNLLLETADNLLFENGTDAMLLE